MSQTETEDPKQPKKDDEPAETGTRSLLDRALRIAGDVRAGEGKSALALAATLFTLLFAYYLLKVARESLVLSSYDPEVKVYVAAAQVVVLTPAVWTYGWLVSRIGRFQLVAAVTVFFAANLAIFAVLYGLDVPIAIPFYVWVGVFNVFVIAQLWAFANDVYDEKRGRRLFAVIGLGSSLGAIAGSYCADPVGYSIGTTGLLIVPIFLLLSTLLGAWWVHQHPFEKRDGETKAEEKTEPKKSAKGGLALLLHDRWLMLIALLLLLLNCENTIGEYILDRVMQTQIHDDLAAHHTTVTDDMVEASVREFKSYYFGAFNTLAFLLQLFVAGRVMKKGGAGVAILVLPVVALLAQAGILISGAALMVVASAKVLENSVDYSIQSTGNNALFLVTPKDTKYKVKVLIDSIVVRLGDVVAGGLVILGAGVLDLSPMAFAGASAVIAVGWIAVAVFVRRGHDARAAKREAAPSGEAEPAA